MVNRQPSAGNLFLGQPSTDRSAFRTFPSNEFSFVDLSIDTHGQLAAKYRSSRFSSGVHDFSSRPGSLNTVGIVRIVSTNAAFFESFWKSINDRVTCFNGSTSKYRRRNHPEGNTRSQILAIESTINEETRETGRRERRRTEPGREARRDENRRKRSRSGGEKRQGTENRKRTESWGRRSCG